MRHSRGVTPSGTAGKASGASRTEGTGVRAVRGGAIRTASYAVVVLLGAATAPLLVRHLGIVTYGKYVTITALVTVVAGVADLGITAVGIREWVQIDPHERRNLLAQLLGTRLAVTALGVGVALLFGLAAGYGATELAGIAVSGFALFVVAYYEALLVPLQAELRQGWIAAAEIARQLVQFAAVLSLILVGAGLLPLLAAAVPAAAAAAAVLAARSPARGVGPSFSPTAWWRLIRSMVPFAAASAVGIVYLRSTLLVTSLVAGSRQTGYFGTAFRVMEIEISLPVVVLGVVFPAIAAVANDNREQLRSLSDKLLTTTLALGALLAAITFAGAPLAISIITGKGSVAPATHSLMILGLALTFSFVSSGSQYALLALHMHRTILAVNLSALVLNLILTALLSRIAGAVGAAAALAACEAYVATAATVRLRRSLDAGRLHLGLIGKVCLAAGLSVLAAVLLGTQGDIAAAVGGIGASGIIFLALGLVPEEVLHAIPGV